ncbi:hypothetical protein PF008_g2837 [Phytophthora fragariae]|uniref:Uncharacterized protein n=1 Tax=Phytophthora fragariae TaxID=53985 RepID=A0A6G0SHX9_9STRA|nr:hypothetical protein PF008_g2837 [Phytophthora fragariae]
MTITESTQRQLFQKTTSRLHVIRVDQKRHAPQKDKAVAALGTWTVEEHQLFLAALELYPSGPWKRIAQHVGTRTPRQLMTHAQKYRQRLQRRAASVTTTTEREAPRPTVKKVGARVLSVVVSPMHTAPPAVATGEIQVEAGVCVTNADELPSYGHFPHFDVDFDFLTQLATDLMFDSVDVSADLEPLQF